jgi:hypothetical protein
MSEIILKGVQEKDKVMWLFWLRRRYGTRSKLTTLIKAAIIEIVGDEANKYLAKEGYSEEQK